MGQTANYTFDEKVLGLQNTKVNAELTADSDDDIFLRRDVKTTDRNCIES